MKLSAKFLSRGGILFFIFLLLVSIPIFMQAQAGPEMPESHAHATLDWNNIATWFGILELPFLFLCIYFAFATASALKGGAFGKGMNLMAWGFLVMGIGHLNMQLDHFIQFNILNDFWANNRHGGMVLRFGGDLVPLRTWILQNDTGKQG